MGGDRGEWRPGGCRSSSSGPAHRIGTQPPPPHRLLKAPWPSILFLVVDGCHCCPHLLQGLPCVCLKALPDVLHSCMNSLLCLHLLFQSLLSARSPAGEWLVPGTSGAMPTATTHSVCETGETEVPPEAVWSIMQT